MARKTTRRIKSKLQTKTHRNFQVWKLTKMWLLLLLLFLAPLESKCCLSIHFLQWEKREMRVKNKYGKNDVQMCAKLKIDCSENKFHSIYIFFLRLTNDKQMKIVNWFLLALGAQLHNATAVRKLNHKEKLLPTTQPIGWLDGWLLRQHLFSNIFYGNLSLLPLEW